MTSPPLTLINGEISEHISISDRGLQYGDGVFETIAVHHGQPLLWQQHIARLLDGCERLDIKPAPDTESLRQHADELCADAQQAVLKVLVTRGESGRGYAIPAQCRPNRIVMLSYQTPQSLGASVSTIRVAVAVRRRSDVGRRR
jgi:4-amino-4-deoxychorismate lyase